MEATEVVPREWSKQQDQLKKAKVGTFGLQGDLNALVQGIQDHIDGYEAQLHSRLSELGAQTVPTPDVPHSEVALRASRRIAPYQAGDKDGYRDTLIWLTVLDIATKHPDLKVWFVSNNTKDFGDPSINRAGDANGGTPPLPWPWHPDLEQDLHRQGLQGRVKYVISLASLEQHLAAEHGPIPDQVLEQLKSSVDYEALRRLLSQRTNIQVPAVDLAMNPELASAVVSKFLPSELAWKFSELAWKFSEAAGRGDTRWTANFVVDAKAEILGLGEDLFDIVTITTKPVRVAGTVAISRQGEPLDLQVSTIEALPDDPDRGLFELMKGFGFGPKEYGWVRDPQVTKNLDQLSRIAVGLTHADLEKMLGTVRNTDG